MTVGILMLHCGLGIRNANIFYTFRCPQSVSDQAPLYQERMVSCAFELYHYVKIPSIIMN